MIDKSMDLVSKQGNLCRPINHYQPNLMRSLSPHAASQFESAHIKQEQVDNGKNDSGLASGSDFHSSSPDSETSQESRHSLDQLLLNGFYQHATRSFVYPPSLLAPPTFRLNLLNQNPLTPPDSASSDRASPKSEHEETDLDSTLVIPSPSRENNDDNQNHLKSLELSVKQFPTNGENAMEIPSSEVCDKSLKIPKVNSHGKVKISKCKYCKLDFMCKDELWMHLKSHIPEDKQLLCTFDCPFVTEFKHHLEYHLRKHTGSKPFQCDKCDYTCSTKSMLTSHSKSHTNLYQYTCKDCQYASKYCHAFKVHLRRYKHEPNVPLDESGKPCPEIVIDVYGKRRGPRVKKSRGVLTIDQNSSPESFDVGKLMQARQSLNLFPPVFNQPANLQFMQGLLQMRALAAAAAAASSPMVVEPQEQVLDLSRSGCSSWDTPQKKRNKGSAFSSWSAREEDRELGNTSLNDSLDDDPMYEKERSCTTMFSNVEAMVQAPESPQKDAAMVTEREIEKKCHHCNMTFGDEALYHIHMTYHGSPDPFTCNMCKEECKDKVAFSLHIIRVAH